jgi:hypothetical protein
MSAHYATILSGDESLAADIFKAPGAERYTVHYVDNDARRDTGIPAIVGLIYGVTSADHAFRYANAWVTQSPAPRLTGTNPATRWIDS